MKISVRNEIVGKPGGIRSGIRSGGNASFSSVLKDKAEQIGTNSAIFRPETEPTVKSTCPQSGFRLLGEISPQDPTVSHLLIRNPDFQESCWEIIHSGLNRVKPFRRIKEGTRIYINEANFEIVWSDGNTATGLPTAALPVNPEPVNRTAVQTKPEQGPFTRKWVEAVQEKLGVEYDQVDCYELLVESLRTLGYRYGGSGGLKESLIRLAQSRGEAINTYFSGEGLLEVTGSDSYVKTISASADSDKDADAIMDDIASRIQPGQILSFSTPTRGHTGIISNREGSWTYLNSGRLDHSLTSESPMKGVGEEMLTLEILNWVRLAARRKEPLTLTLGNLDERKLEKYKHVSWDA